MFLQLLTQGSVVSGTEILTVVVNDVALNMDKLKTDICNKFSIDTTNIELYLRHKNEHGTMTEIRIKTVNDIQEGDHILVTENILFKDPLFSVPTRKRLREDPVDSDMAEEDTNQEQKITEPENIEDNNVIDENGVKENTDEPTAENVEEEEPTAEIAEEPTVENAEEPTAENAEEPMVENGEVKEPEEVQLENTEELDNNIGDVTEPEGTEERTNMEDVAENECTAVEEHKDAEEPTNTEFDVPELSCQDPAPETKNDDEVVIWMEAQKEKNTFNIEISPGSFEEVEINRTLFEKCLVYGSFRRDCPETKVEERGFFNRLGKVPCIVQFGKAKINKGMRAQCHGREEIGAGVVFSTEAVSKFLINPKTMKPSPESQKSIPVTIGSKSYDRICACPAVSKPRKQKEISRIVLEEAHDEVDPTEDNPEEPANDEGPEDTEKQSEEEPVNTEEPTTTTTNTKTTATTTTTTKRRTTRRRGRRLCVEQAERNAAICDVINRFTPLKMLFSQPDFRMSPVQLVNARQEEGSLTLIVRGSVGPKYPKSTLYRIGNYTSLCRKYIQMNNPAKKYPRWPTTNRVMVFCLKDNNETCTLEKMIPCFVKTTRPEFTEMLKSLEERLKLVQRGTFLDCSDIITEKIATFSLKKWRYKWQKTRRWDDSDTSSDDADRDGKSYDLTTLLQPTKETVQEDISKTKDIKPVLMPPLELLLLGPRVKTEVIDID